MPKGKGKGKGKKGADLLEPEHDPDWEKVCTPAQRACRQNRSSRFCKAWRRDSMTYTSSGLHGQLRMLYVANFSGLDCANG